MKIKLQSAINQGVLWLTKNQKKDGSFSCFNFLSQNGKKQQENFSIFPTCLILASLSVVSSDKARNLKTKSLRFLLGQKSSSWSFNYWKRKSSEYKNLPYPDDLDDTCCALAAIQLNNSKIINGSVIGHLVNLLTFCEAKEGGPYNTWIVPQELRDKWRDVDLAVNSNIAFFLSLQEVSLESINQLVEKSIEKQNFKSSYYYSPFASIYFISRFYQGSKKSELIDYILRKCDREGKWNNPLDTALAISALINLGCPNRKIEKGIKYLIATQSKTGNWPTYPFVVELVRKEDTYLAGSSELTTALCLEALAKFEKLVRISREKLEKTREKEDIIRKILASVKKDNRYLDNQLRQEFDKVVSEITKNDSTREIMVLPYLFRESLGEKGKNISSAMLVDLGRANLYGWVAYSIYDDFFDNEGEIERLSIANIALRRSMLTLEKFFSDKKDKELFLFVMDKLDEANCWEVNNCRLEVRNSLVSIPRNFPWKNKNYDNLINRSLGHILGVLAIGVSLGYSLKSKDLRNLISFFRRYILIRQLNDDMHDWEKDLARGQISPIVAEVLARYPAGKKRSLNIKKDKLRLQKIFWHEIVGEINQFLLKETSLARKTLSSLNILENPEIIGQLVNRLEKIVLTTEKERKDTIRFLEYCRQ